MSCELKVTEKPEALKVSKACWFNEARFGMFIHWGPYASAGRGEWVANRESIPYAEYLETCVKPFKGENYDPREWAQLAKEAGMRYMVLTTRHHDGFALWPTKTSDFHAGNYGPKQDLVAPFVDACREAGLKVGFYYSPAAWYHPDYPGSDFRDWPDNGDWDSREAHDRFVEFYREQVIELMSNYGKIDYLWYDGSIPNDLQTPEVNEAVLELQPDILINERNGPPFHVLNCEQAIKPPTQDALWEACMTLNDNWGFHQGDSQWKHPKQVLQMLCDTARSGGNLLLNVGPMADGSIPQQSIEILKEVGDWLVVNGEAIYNSDRSPLSWTNWGKAIVRGNFLYLVIFNDVGSELCYAELNNKVVAASYVDGGEAIDFSVESGRLTLRGLKPSGSGDIGQAIRLELDGPAEPRRAQTSFWIPG